MALLWPFIAAVNNNKTDLDIHLRSPILFSGY